MIRFALVLPFLLFLLSAEAESQKQPLLKKDIQQEWQVSSGEKYIPYKESDSPAFTIYFPLNSQAFKGDYLQIKSAGNFSVFVNRQFFFNAVDSAVIFMDSLASYNSGKILVGVNCSDEITEQSLSTRIYSEIQKETVQAENIPMLRKSTHFKDFVITATIFLFVFFVLMIHLNPRLSSDYFSVPKLFSMRETDDDQFYLRITSANILFYAFTSLILGLFFFMVQEFAIVGHHSSYLKIATFADTLLAWFKLSILVFAVLFLKIVLIFLVSFLFDITDSAGYHFFNFIRLMLVIVTLMTLILVGYYLIHGTSEEFYTFLFKALGWATGLWTIILFFKLSNRVRFSPIHLFSYICATEIIPFLILIKLLYE